MIDYKKVKSKKVDMDFTFIVAAQTMPVTHDGGFDDKNIKPWVLRANLRMLRGLVNSSAGVGFICGTTFQLRNSINEVLFDRQINLSSLMWPQQTLEFYNFEQLILSDVNNVRIISTINLIDGSVTSDIVSRLSCELFYELIRY